MSHDRRTMLRHFRDRLTAGKTSPGLLIVAQDAPTADVMEALLVLWAVADPEEPVKVPVVAGHATIQQWASD